MAEGRIYGTKGKDLNGLSQKAFSYSPWQTTMAKWREREHILNRFLSSVRDIFMCRATGYRCLPVCVRIARLRCFVSPPLSRRACSLRGLVSFFFGGSEFKRFKAISLGVARRILSSSNADRPTHTFSSVPLAFLLRFLSFLGWSFSGTWIFFRELVGWIWFIVWR